LSPEDGDSMFLQKLRRRPAIKHGAKTQHLYKNMTIIIVRASTLKKGDQLGGLGIHWRIRGKHYINKGRIYKPDSLGAG
jgi:hypothetical protein